MASISQLLKSPDPLSLEALEFLISYREEDSRVDYKETFHPEVDKDWLELTKDIMAFANTEGGYLVFGVRDGTFEVVGLELPVITALTNTNMVLQKLNRHIEPELGLLRSKPAEISGKPVVVHFIPPSYGLTHTISKDGKFKFPSGDEKTILHKGTLYVRRSAGNHLVDSHDLDDIHNRRLEQFRESLLSKIARVIDAPPESEIFIVTESSAGSREFILSDSTNAAPVKGISFTTPPTTPEETISSWIALSATHFRAIPEHLMLWEWYENRQNLKLSPLQRLGIARFCLLKGVPVFYWLQDAPADEIKGVLLETLSHQIQLTQVDYILSVGSFLGKTFHTMLRSKLKRFEGRLGANGKSYPPSGPRSLIGPRLVEAEKKLFKGSEKAFKVNLESELSKVVANILKTEDDIVGVMEQLKAQAFDCFLYAQDQYNARGVIESVGDEPEPSSQGNVLE